MKKKILKIIAGVIILAVAYFGYQKFFVEPKAAKKVATITVKRGDLKEELTISGQIRAEQDVVLRFQTSGYLTWVGVKEGDYVKKYQGIAALDQRELQKNLQKYLLTYKKSRNDFDATIDADKNQIMTDTMKRALDDLQSDLTSSVLDVEIKDLARRFANLWTPIEGLVIRAESPVAGVNVTPTQAEFEVVNPTTVYFSATADQTEVTKLQATQPGVLRLDAFPDQDITGYITTISFTPNVDETGTVYDVKFGFTKDNSDYHYRLGMTGDLTFVTAGRSNVLILPSKFVKSENGEKYVNLLSDGKKVKTKVTVGLETDSDVEIVSGLSEGNVVSD